MKKKRHRYNKKKASLFIKLVYVIPVFLIALIIGKLTFASKDDVEANQNEKCDLKKQISFKDRKSQLLQGNTNDDKSLCYHFYVQSEQPIIINSNNQVKLQLPDQKISTLQGKRDIAKPGEYTLIIKNNKNYEVSIDIKKTIELPIKNNHDDLIAEGKIERRSTSSREEKISTQLIYNQANPPVFKQDKELQNIVDNIVIVARQRGLRIDKLSISLVDLDSTKSKGYAYASFADNQPRYPASVVKILWMVVLFGQYEKGILPQGKISDKTLVDLIKDSDNEAGSFVLDTITKTQSGSSLSLETIKAWKAKRDTVNIFFNQAGYTNINISQKTYPIPYLKMNLPIGRDKQLRDKNLELREQEINPIRNYLTTDSVARLLFEIYSNQSVSDFYSNEMKKLLKRDLHPAAWKNKPYNAIKGFLGEGLPSNIDFYSKMGWTFNNRNDAAIIVSPDGKVRYILVIFGDDKSFYQDKKFLPEVSQLVYQKMTKY